MTLPSANVASLYAEDPTTLNMLFDEVTSRLSQRQQQVFHRVRLGYRLKEIATELGLHPGTIRRYWYDARCKLQRLLLLAT